MAGEPESNSTVPGTVFTPRQVRVLKMAVIVMGVLLVGGFAFVLAAIVSTSSVAAGTRCEPDRVREPCRGRGA